MSRCFYDLTHLRGAEIEKYFRSFFWFKWKLQNLLSRLTMTFSLFIKWLTSVFQFILILIYISLFTNWQKFTNGHVHIYFFEFQVNGRNVTGFWPNSQLAENPILKAVLQRIRDVQILECKCHPYQWKIQNFMGFLNSGTAWKKCLAWVRLNFNYIFEQGKP